MGARLEEFLGECLGERFWESAWERVWKSFWESVWESVSRRASGNLYERASARQHAASRLRLYLASSIFVITPQSSSANVLLDSHAACDAPVPRGKAHWSDRHGRKRWQLTA